MSDEDCDGCGVEECSSGFDGRLGVLQEPAVAIDPREEALDHPAPWLDCEPDLVGFAFDAIATAMEVVLATRGP